MNFVVQASIGAAVRADFLICIDGRGVVKAELGGTVLNSPRAPLEDVSVFHSRRGIEATPARPGTVVIAKGFYSSLGVSQP